MKTTVERIEAGGTVEQNEVRTSFHESGHAVMAASAGVGVARASIGMDAAAQSSGRVEYRKVVGVPVNLAIMCSLAGGIATQLQFGVIHSDEMGGDERTIEKYSLANGGVTDEQMQGLIASVGLTLAKYWRAVDVVAKELLEHGELAGDRVSELMQRARSMPPLKPPYAEKMFGED
jgi:hypothetical protein